MAEAKKTTAKIKTKKVAKNIKTKGKEIKDGTIQIDDKAKVQASSQDEEVKTTAKPKVTTTKQPTAKAGKRSTKAVKEVEEKRAKEERKTHAKEEEVAHKPKHPEKPPRSKLERRSKKYREAAKQIEADKDYTLEDALALAVKTSPTKFDATVELHINLAVDPKQADQNVRGTVVLPAGTGKASRVAVVAEADDAKKAKTAGADVVGSDDILAQLDKEKLDFDVLIATPAMMARLGKYARVLGPKGLMPNPKSGTVTNDVVKAVTEAKAGRVEYRVDTAGIVHVGIGKVSFGAAKLNQNAQAIFTNLKTHKPASVKGALIMRAYVTTSMGPSISLTLSSV